MRSEPDQLPDDYLRRIQSLEEAYLRSMDPIVQSGFSGGPERWRREREPILDAVEGDGDILDVGCANGYLLHCLVKWGLERGLRLVPHGVDVGPRLIKQARLWHPDFAENFYVANAWDWRPPRRSGTFIHCTTVCPKICWSRTRDACLIEQLSRVDA